MSANPFEPPKAPMSTNPFEPPKAPIGKSATTADPRVYHVEGKSVVVASGVSLPHRCVYCDEEQGEDGKRIGKDLYYVRWYVYLLFLISPIILLIVYFVVRKPVFVMHSICGRHRRKKRRNVVLCILSLAAMMIGIIAGAVAEIPALVGLGFLMILPFLLFLVLANRGLVPHKRKDERFWIKGFGKAFLDHLAAERIGNV